VPPHEEQEERIRARLALLIALAALVAIAAGPVSGSETPPLRAAADGHTSVKRCKTVTPHTYNKRVRLLREISGDNRRGTLTKRKRCKYGAYADLGRAVRKARADCLKKVNHPEDHNRNKAGTTGASFYSYGDSGGLTGACGTFLPNFSADYSFAILGTGDVRSVCGQRFYFHRHGVTRSGFQADTGGGGGYAGGYPRTFDFWNPNQECVNGRCHRPGLARDLRLTSADLGSVQYSKHNCWAR